MLVNLKLTFCDKELNMLQNSKQSKTKVKSNNKTKQKQTEKLKT